MNIEKKKSFKGIGWYGKVFQYDTSVSCGVATDAVYKGKDKKVQELQKHPAMKKAAKKAARRHNDKFYAE